jgi:hypothetical protein
MTEFDLDKVLIHNHSGSTREIKPMTQSPYASAEECRPLYELINRVREMAPWEWMYEDDLFAVQNPESDEWGFVSIMGYLGEHYAVAVYLGLRGLAGFRYLQEAGPFMTAEDIFKVPQLQVSLEDREFLEPQDRDQIKRLGLKYRGRNAWPLFRSHRPGYLPWYLEPDEARFLAYVLEQVLEVAPRVRNNPDILRPRGKNQMLVRVAVKEGPDWVWRDEIKKFGAPKPLDLTIELDQPVLDAIMKFPRKPGRVEVDYFMLPNSIHEKGRRPYFPYSLMMVDTTHHAIIGMELLSPIPDLEAMWGGLGSAVLKIFHQNGWLPAELDVRDDLLFGILTMLSSKIGVKVKQENELPMLDDAADGLIDYLNRR